MSLLEDRLVAGDCPVAPCTRRIADGHLMCRVHWFLVPRTVREEVWATWRLYNRGRRNLRQLRDVQQKAVDEVALRIRTTA